MSHHEDSTATSNAFGRLMDLIKTLRAENGCPWDRKQTPQTLHPYILEEYHEMVDAINRGSANDIADEFGDLIFLVVLVAYMFEQQGLTTLEAILNGVIEKMTRRHPHVFGDVRVNDAQDVVDNWSLIKASEEKIRERQSILDGIPRSLPALSRAQKLARRAAKVGFDWEKPDEVMRKVDEELEELKQAMASGSIEDAREELGDLLFVTANVARHLQINSELALSDTSDKFEKRFRHVEARLREQGKSLSDAGLAEMDELWDEAKSLERAAKHMASKT